MKSLILIILSILACTLSAKSQEIQVALRDTYFVRLGWQSRQGWMTGTEMSLFNSAERNQIGRIYAGYTHRWTGNLELTTAGTTAINFENRYKQFGLYGKVSKDYQWIKAEATLYPNYDSQLKMQWDGEIEASGHVLSDLDLCISYGNIPEYREDLKYLRIGLLFKAENLWVKPMINLPNINNEHMRIIVSLGWKFKFNK